ncbi:putative protein OCTOPUS [Helianthus annuus]|nr:putative protein OCTOPUS [Helianthus annuus]KAJ0799477.1 putative protein OCTOPUS [Helianthus annuus]
MMPHPQHRTVTKNRTRTRRFYACHRHPNQPVTGFCALCLRDRLAGLEDSSSSSAPVPEFRRSKSVAGEICKDVSDFAVDLRRNSCDVRVRARNTLSDLFAVHDSVKLKVIDRVASVESVKLGFVSKECGEIRVLDDDDREIRVSDDVIVHDDCEIRVSNDVIELNHEIRVSDDDEVTQGDLKTMKEIIEMELKNNKRNLRSVFGQKLRKWRKKQKEKKQSRCINGGIESTRSKLGQLSKIRDTQSEVGDYGFGRRSCDTEPRFSIDAHRLSVEDPRCSLDEHRASWDGYMIARTIPRLTPMLPVVDNMMLGPVNKGTNATTMENLNLNLQMHSISEDGASSGGSAQSNSDCCSSSNRGSSSSSMMSSSTKAAGFGCDDVKSASNARVSPASDVVFQGTKLVITEKELKDWRLNSIKNNNSNVESVSNAPNSTSKTSTTNITNPSNELKKKVMSSRWKKVCNIWSHKLKLDDKNGDKKSSEHMTESRVEIGNSSAKLVRNPSTVNSRTRRDEFVLDRNRSTRYSTSDIDSGLLRLYLTPFRNSRRSKFVKSRAPPSMVTNGLQLQ